MMIRKSTKTRAPTTRTVAGLSHRIHVQHHLHALSLRPRPPEQPDRRPERRRLLRQYHHVAAETVLHPLHRRDRRAEDPRGVPGDRGPEFTGDRGREGELNAAFFTDDPETRLLPFAF